MRLCIFSAIMIYFMESTIIPAKFNIFNSILNVTCNLVQCTHFLGVKLDSKCINAAINHILF